MERTWPAGIGQVDLVVSPPALIDDQFYADLAAFDRFDDVTQFDAYRPVPEDWVVMISDVVGSTAAIRAGRYKQVNMMGAATITAVLTACATTELPFVFGGDGGTLVLPGGLAPAARDALLDLQATSIGLYGLELRVGAVPVAEIRRRGRDVTVRKFRLSPGNHLAMLAGGGVELADDLLKASGPDDGWLLTSNGERGPPDLEGLSCRWQPLASRDGCMMTLMICGPRGGHGGGPGDDPAGEGALLTAIAHILGHGLGGVLTAIAHILGHGLDASAPANDRSMHFRWPPAGAALEARSIAKDGPVWKKHLWVSRQPAWSRPGANVSIARPAPTTPPTTAPNCAPIPISANTTACSDPCSTSPPSRPPRSRPTSSMNTRPGA